MFVEGLIKSRFAHTRAQPTLQNCPTRAARRFGILLASCLTNFEHAALGGTPDEAELAALKLRNLAHLVLRIPLHKRKEGDQAKEPAQMSTWQHIKLRLQLAEANEWTKLAELASRDAETEPESVIQLKREKLYLLK